MSPASIIVLLASVSIVSLLAGGATAYLMGGDDRDVGAPIQTSASQPLRVAPGAGLRLAHVLGEQPCGTAQGSVVRDLKEPERCWELGPASVDGTAFSLAEGSYERLSDAWSISVTPVDERRDQLNDLFNQCFDRSSACPTATIAIIVRDRVGGAPTVHGPDIANGPTFVITGGFTQAEVNSLLRQMR